MNTDLSCSNNGYVTLGACFCYEGYTGPACQMCDIGYQKNERGICKKSKSGAPITEISFENP